MALNAAQAVVKARQEITNLVGQPISCVLGCAPEGDKWRVSLETVERKAIPDSSDLLATYVVILDADGVLMNFQRTRVRRRGEPMEER